MPHQSTGITESEKRVEKKSATTESESLLLKSVVLEVSSKEDYDRLQRGVTSLSGDLRNSSANDHNA
jgi:hypothetical protein